MGQELSAVSGASWGGCRGSSDRRHAMGMRNLTHPSSRAIRQKYHRDDALMHPTFIIDKEPRRDFTGPSLILFILLSIFSMVASIDPAAREEATAKIVATLQVATSSTSDDDDELPPAIIPTAPQLKLIVLRGRFETPQNDTLPHLQFESAFNPRGPPQLGGTTSA